MITLLYGVAAVLQRRAELSVSIIERQLYLDVSGQNYITSVVEHRFG